MIFSMSIEDPSRIPAIDRINEVRPGGRREDADAQRAKQVAAWEARLEEIEAIFQAGGAMDYEALVAERRSLKQQLAANGIDRDQQEAA